MLTPDDWKKDTFRIGALPTALYVLAGIWMLDGHLLYSHWMGVDSLASRTSFSITLFIVFLPAGAVGAVGTALHRREQKRAQIVRDGRATYVCERLRKGEEVPAYSVYLRSFAVTGHLGVRHSDETVMGTVAHTPSEADLETLLARALETFLPMVGLGRPGEHHGAGRFDSSQSEWQVWVDLLVENCTAIVMIPSDTAGTLWELDLIIQRQLSDKVVLVMPKSDRMTGLNPEKQWAAATEVLTQRGVQLPVYDKRGMLMRIARTGATSRTEGFPRRLGPRELRAVFRRILA